MSSILLETDQALASYAAQHRGRPVAVYLGERKFTQLTLDVALLGAPALALTPAGPAPTATWSCCATRCTWMRSVSFDRRFNGFNGLRGYATCGGWLG